MTAGSAAAVIAELDVLIEALTEAMAATRTGDAVDLSGIDARIAEVCRAAEAVRGPDRDAVAARLDELVRTLEATATALRERLDADSSAERRKAAAAYGKTQE